MSALHLIWIIPVSCLFGMLLAIIVMANKE